MAERLEVYSGGGMTSVREKVEGLVLLDLRKRFGELEVLKGISLEVKKGEFFTLLGPSGCGKTTLLRLVGGFDTLLC